MAEFNDFVFQSGFKDAIAGLIALKHGLGLKYYGPALVLKRFDNFCSEHYSKQDILSKEVVSDWFSLCRRGKPKTVRLLMTPVSHLGTYLCNMGTSAYVFPVKTLPPDQRYTPHIYSTNELQRFFAATDDCRYTCAAPLRHHIMPVFFRLIYCCGLRVSEAILLKTGDADLTHGVLTIRESKNGGERYVPMSEEMRLRCVSYWDAVHDGKQKHLYFFPSPPQEKITYMNIYGNFRRFLRNAGISHGGRKNPIRIHDFRYPYINKIRTFSKTA
ncbi:tyrosine-type recombinase/integrase [Desulfoscipio gibsoniae]